MKSENGIIVRWARRQADMTRPTNESAPSQSVSQSVSDRFDVDGKSAALASGPEISERQRRHAGIRHKRERREGYILISGS